MKLHVRAKVFLYLHVNSIAIYVWRLPMSRFAQNDGYAAQTNQTPDPTLTLTPTLALWGARCLLSRSAGAVLSLRAIIKTLHVRAMTCNETPGGGFLPLLWDGVHVSINCLAECTLLKVFSLCLLFVLIPRSMFAYEVTRASYAHLFERRKSIAN